MTTTRTYATGYSVTHSDTLYVCGGGRNCPKTDGLTASVVTNSMGALRCLPCAERLGWPTS